MILDEYRLYHPKIVKEAWDCLISIGLSRGKKMMEHLLDRGGAEALLSYARKTFNPSDA